MRSRDLIICFLSVIVAVALLMAASARLPHIETARKELGLVSNEPLENAPPSLAFATVAMGAFRGLVVDILWMRADTLKEEGQFFDAKQLAEWITVLQPRFATVWDFHAWNMAYNISVAIPNTQWQERWKWVRNGYELLRDKGIPKNPHSILLYRSLAWIFQHKIAGVSDDCHRHYKRELALDMRQLLGYPETNETFEKLAAAPETLDELKQNPAVAEIVNALQNTDDKFSDQKDFAEKYLLLRRNPDSFNAATFEVIDSYRGKEALEKLDAFARAYQLKSIWKMDVNLMRELNAKYGPGTLQDPNDRNPLNWEHPATHSIYWAELGLKMAGSEEYSVNEKNTDRIVFHGLQQLYRSGKIVIYPIQNQPASVFLEPDLLMFDSTNQLWKNKILKYELLEKGNPKAVRGGHRNFLKNAVESFYEANHIGKAQIIYDELRKTYPRKEFDVPLIVFIKSRLKDVFKGLGDKDAIEFIIFNLRRAYFLYAIRYDDKAAGHENYARQAYDIFQKEMGIDEPGRMGLPPFERLMYHAFIGFMNDMAYPQEMRARLLGRIKVEKPELFEQLMQQETQFMDELRKSQSQTTP